MENMKRDLDWNDRHLEKVRAFHDQDAAHYKELRYHAKSCEGLMYLTRKKLVLELIGNGGGRILDLACGPGIFTTDLAALGFKVLSADLSMEMIRTAKERVSPGECRDETFFMVGDASHISVGSDGIDGAICIGLMCYVPDYKAVLRELYRVLKDGAPLIIQIDYMRWPALHRALVPLYQKVKSLLTSKRYDTLTFHFNYFPCRRFVSDLQACGFRIADMVHYDFRVPFVDLIFPGLSLTLGKLMFEHRRSPLLQCLSHGLLVRGIKSNKQY